MGKIKIDELREYLRTSKSVEFEYEKTDGTKRLAHGTLSEICIPGDKKPKKDSDFKKGKNLRYYDIEKESWRSIAASVNEVELKTVTMIIHTDKQLREYENENDPDNLKDEMENSKT